MTAVEWIDGRIRFIDQTKLPLEENFVETSDYHVVGDAIRTLQIRGAPAIGVAAAFALVLAVSDRQITSVEKLHSVFSAAEEFLSRTRPTAVNLFVSLKRLRQVIEQHASSDVELMRDRLRSEAMAIQHEDLEACRRIGELGATLIGPGSSILTHCNTGALATAGEGTALSIIAAAARLQKVVRVFVGETRPLFQGARLTAWELLRMGIDVTLITDSTAGVVLSEHRVQAVIVGADRIAANGDTANKVGTYPLAVLADRHGVPFFVAAPTSTIDIETPSGKSIRIEERDAREVTHVAGVQIAPPGVKVFSPAFDVTPNELITAIVTEVGILRGPYGQSIAGLGLKKFHAEVNAR